MLSTAIATQNPKTTQRVLITSPRRIHQLQATLVASEILLPQRQCENNKARNHKVFRVAGQPQSGASANHVPRCRVDEALVGRWKKFCELLEQLPFTNSTNKAL